MNYANLLRYFTRSLKDRTSITKFSIAGVLLVGGYSIYRYVRLGSFVINNMIFIALAAVAAVLCVTTFTAQTKGRELDEEVRRVVKAFAEETEQTFLPAGNVRQMKQSEERKKNCKSVLLQAYLFEGKDLLYKKGKEGKMRTTCYGVGSIFLFREEIGIGELRFSLREKSEERKTKLLPYTQLSGVQSEAPQLPEGCTKADYVLLSIRDNEGKELFSIPAGADSITDQFVEELNHRIETAKAKQAKED